jgi:hypothetical protein
MSHSEGSRRLNQDARLEVPGVEGFLSCLTVNDAGPWSVSAIDALAEIAQGVI